MSILLLDNGMCFYGEPFGFAGTAIGEICFNTGMTGYQEIFTDPSYFGQVLIMNNVHIGNYGILEQEEQESNNVNIKALVGRNLEHKFSRRKSKLSLHDYLVQQKIVAITNIDTRALVTIIRKYGSMNVIVSNEDLPIDELKKKLKLVPNMEGLALSSYVSTKQIYNIGNPNARHTIAVMDYGIKQNIIKCLLQYDVYLKIYPHNTKFETVNKDNPDAFFLSNGPGDPCAMKDEIEEVKKISATDKPVFGICLGHQLICLAAGLRTQKLKYGHRGINHPVKNLIKNTSEITTQNHGFGLDDSSMVNNPAVIVTHVNLNDNSIEGIKIKNKKIFSVQYHPESTPGPYDSRYLFHQFINMLS